VIVPKARTDVAMLFQFLTIIGQKWDGMLFFATVVVWAGFLPKRFNESSAWANKNFRPPLLFNSLKYTPTRAYKWI
jgi:hypothetical protein